MVGRPRKYHSEQERKDMLRIYMARYKEKSLMIERKRIIIQLIKDTINKLDEPFLLVETQMLA
jgi:hypothetical protein